MTIATTRIIPMHITNGKTLAQSISDRTDYGLNPEKTNDGELTSAYACDPRSFASEVLVSKRQYKAFTGKDEKSDVLVYQVRQSFKPGEITPEEANQIGYDFASRFLKGKHALLFAPILIKPTFTITSIGTPLHLIANGSSEISAGHIKLWQG